MSVPSGPLAANNVIVVKSLLYEPEKDLPVSLLVVMPNVGGQLQIAAENSSSSAMLRCILSSLTASAFACRSICSAPAFSIRSGVELHVFYRNIARHTPDFGCWQSSLDPALFAECARLATGRCALPAVTSDKRAGFALPDVPTAEEAGLANYQIRCPHCSLAGRQALKAIVDNGGTLLKVVDPAAQAPH